MVPVLLTVSPRFKSAIRSSQVFLLGLSPSPADAGRDGCGTLEGALGSELTGRTGEEGAAAGVAAEGGLLQIESRDT